MDPGLSKELIDSLTDQHLARNSHELNSPGSVGNNVREVFFISHNLLMQTFQEYLRRIQDAYIEKSEKHYIQLDDRMLADSDFPEYLRQVNDFLDKEFRRWSKHFKDQKNPAFLALINKVFINPHADLYKKNFISLLEQGTKDDIYRLYKICARFKDAMIEIKAIEHEYIENLVRKYEKDPRGLMEELMTGPAFKLIDAHNRVDCFIKYPIPRDFGEISTKIAVLTARHCDSLMKRSKSRIDDAELDDQLQTILAVISYIDDKDVFQRMYAKLLAKRLLDSNAAAESVEKQFVIQLRDICGLEYENKLKTMLTDRELSKDLTACFKEECDSNKIQLQVNFSAKILSGSTWTMLLSPIEIQIPRSLHEAMSYFLAFYMEKHLRRKLIWHHAYAQGELLTNCFKRPYILQAWTPQLTILMLYNEIEATNMSLESIIEQLGVKKETVIPILGTLLKAEILKCDLKGDAEFDETTPETIEFYLNSNFTSKKLKVDLTKVQMASETKKETQKDQEIIEEDRRIKIEACVVRIMKTRKRLAHNDLVSEVISQLSSRFTPNMPKIRIAIESLIERLYLKRDDESMNVYEFNA